MITPKKSLAHVQVYKEGLSGKGMIKLASNENAYGSSEKLGGANYARYPDAKAVTLRQSVAKFAQVLESQLIFGAGTDEIIMMICRAYLEPDDEMITASTTFPQYCHQAKIEGAKCKEIPLLNGKYDLQNMLNFITSKTKLIFISNPNNPTGTVCSDTEITAFMDEVPSTVLVILDEAYIEYAKKEPTFLRGYDNLIVLRTFSKIYGLAALRVGYGVSTPEIIRTLEKVKGPFNVSRVAQEAACEALTDSNFIKKTHDQNILQREYLMEELTKLGLEYFPSVTNFLMIDMKKSAQEVFDYLWVNQITIRAGFPEYPNHLRMTIGTQQENEAFIQVLKRYIE